MRAGEAKVALESRARELDQWLKATGPVHPDHTRIRNPEAEKDAVERSAHREMVDKVTPFRAEQEALEENRPRFQATDFRDLGMDYIRRRKAHTQDVADGRVNLVHIVNMHRFEGQECQSLIETKQLALTQAWEHASQVHSAQERLSDIRYALRTSADIPAMLPLHAPAGQPLHEVVEKHAIQWRGRVTQKGIMDALARAFPDAAQPIVHSDGQEAALLRSHILYSEMFCAALREMRKHPDAGFDPQSAERKVRRIVSDAIGEGGDPMDALVHGINAALEEAEPTKNYQISTVISPR